jgi:hypothetical protein
MGNITAQLLATLIRTNTEQHLAGQLERADWSKKQRELWRMAERRKVDNRVRALLAPSYQSDIVARLRSHDGPVKVKASR